MNGAELQVRSTAGTLQTLQGQVSSEVEGASKLRVSQLDAREKLLADTEARLRESQRRSEEECIRLQAMLQALEGTVKEQREQVRGVRVCVRERENKRDRELWPASRDTS